MNFLIKKISAEDCYDLRGRVLRPGQPIETYMYAEDHDKNSFHLGLFIDDKIVCNGTFLEQKFSNVSKSYNILLTSENEKLLSQENSYRLRGMATDPNEQGKKLGQKLVQAAIEELRQKHCPILWFNARTSALNFYLKLGATIVSDVFEINGAGPHVVMYIKINQI